jgi:hypothetical protein
MSRTRAAEDGGDGGGGDGGGMPAVLARSAGASTQLLSEALRTNCTSLAKKSMER